MLVFVCIINDKLLKDDGIGQGGNKVELFDVDFFGQILLLDLIGQGVQVMNNFWGGLYFDLFNVVVVGIVFVNVFCLFVIDYDGLVVFVIGNEGFIELLDIVVIFYYVFDLECGWLVVVVFDLVDLVKQQLVVYFNVCGKVMNYCLVVLGDVIIIGVNDMVGNLDYYFVQGILFFILVVVGVVVDVWQVFLYFNNDLVWQILFGIVKDFGVLGVDVIYGYGLFDVGKVVKGFVQFNWGDVMVSFIGLLSWDNLIFGVGGLIK